MIHSIKLAGLRNNEYSQFIDNFLQVVHRFEPSILMVEEEYHSLEVISNSIKNLLNTATGSGITDELVTYDHRRDEAINGILLMVTGFTYSGNETLKKAARRLDAHLSGFGQIARESYQNETSKIQKIIEDWNVRVELSSAVTLLGLDSWKEELQMANTAFNDRYVDRALERATSNPEKVYNKRPGANTLFYNLRDRLNAFYTIKRKAEPFSSAIDALNGVIKDYNDLLAARAARGNTGASSHPATAL